MSRQTCRSRLAWWNRGFVEEEFASGGICRDCEEHILEAQLIQSSLLPTKGLSHESIEIAFRFVPFSAVGGDFVDFFRLPDGCIGICLGDVVGKGLSAAMFAALVMGLLRGIHKTGTDTARVLTLLNERLAQLLLDFVRGVESRHAGTHLLQRGNAIALAGLRNHVPAARRGRITLGNVPGRHIWAARRTTRARRLCPVRDRRPA